MIFPVLLCVFILKSTIAECPQACNGHGKCTTYDMCICYPNWTGNDCGRRVCPFGPAHVDSPKGDLDSSQSITGPDTRVLLNSDIYPYGTTEQFPSMRDSRMRELKKFGT